MSLNNIRLKYILKKSTAHSPHRSCKTHTIFHIGRIIQNWNWMHLHDHQQSIHSVSRRRTIRHWLYIQNHHSIFLRSNFTYQRKLHHYIQFVMERTLKRITEKRLQREVLKHQFLDLKQLLIIGTEIILKAYISIYGLSPNQKRIINDKINLWLSHFFDHQHLSFHRNIFLTFQQWKKEEKENTA